MTRQGFNISELRKEEYQEWDTLILSSRFATLFHTTSFFKGYDHPFTIYLVRKKGAPVLGFITAYEGSVGNRVTLRPTFSPYLGVAVFQDPILPVSFYANTHNAYELLIAQLKADFSKISVRLSPSVTDIQAFVW